MRFADLKIFKLFEITSIFAGIPLLYYLDFIPFHKAIPLLIVFLILMLLLLKDNKFDRKQLGFNGFSQWKPIIIRFSIISIVIIVFVLNFSPDSFLILPRERPGLWILIMVLYPLWSVYPQELIYRTWFFHRYKDLFRNDIMLMIINALFFSFSHIIFRNLLVILLTFPGGLMFANTYRRSHSLMVVFLEHMLYGNLIFTVGLGQYFYLPVSTG
jgi:membrane protease YdiL (CAAX protease family)